MDHAENSGNNVDLDKSEQLKTKNDIESNVTRIFELIKSKDLVKNDSNSEDGNQRHSKDDRELVGRIENFYQQYQSLHALYDHLIGESGSVVQKRKGRTSSSLSSPSSSVSDVNYFSPDEIDSIFVKPEDHGHPTMAESSSHGLKSKNLKLANADDIDEVDYSIKEHAEDKKLRDKSIGLHARISELELVLKGKNDEISQLQKKLENEESLASKVAHLMAENDNLQSEIESLTGMQLDSANDESNIETLKEELRRKEVAENKMAEEKQRYFKQLKDMELEVDSLRNDKKNLEKQRRSKMHEADKLKRQNAGLRAKVAELENTLSERGEEVSALRKQCEDVKKEASTQVRNMMTQVSGLKQEVDSLKRQKSQLESHCEKENQEWLKRLSTTENETGKKMLEERQLLLEQVKNMQKEVESLCSKKSSLENKMIHKIHDTDMLRRDFKGLNARILELEKALTKRGEEVEALRRECEDERNKAADASYKVTDLTVQVSDLKQEMDNLRTKKSQLELQIETENKERREKQAEMERKVADQQRIIKENEEFIKQISKDSSNAKIQFPESKLNLPLIERKMEELAKKHRTQFENTLRLYNQRIRVAEHIQIETKEMYQRIKDDHDKETKQIKERLAFFENPLKKMKGMSETEKRAFNILDDVACTFDKHHDKVLNNVSRISADVQLAKTWVKKANIEIKRLQEEAERSGRQLHEKEERESSLRDKPNMMNKFSQLEKQVAKMEKTIKEKDEDLLNLGEEKREAIRQLCVVIDHHHVRYDDLRQLISKRSATPGSY